MLKESWKIFINGLKTALKGCGFTIKKRRYPVERYKWVLLDEDEVGEQCRKKAQWPAMDIADWMKSGLLNSPENNGLCCGYRKVREEDDTDIDAFYSCHCDLLLEDTEHPAHHRQQ